ncbi:inositol monophosphatase family protein [Halalkalibacterium halodurans]|uniref:inositol-phosphate phosphatase n=1 Tax=Halalkalibacterium halodurans TaxID=86665 RepID=A0A0M0KJL5_ALKHA|nr:inositol monophosphatase family protein [Halalkalibacterium halodurans]MED4164841.1 inositol monophosphatase family protein [Halalkalibacterium halodurans]TPE66546.1 inositol monophosphatase family protein [Halalkalibacterium halodurans]
MTRENKWIDIGEIAKAWVVEAAQHIKQALEGTFNVEAKSNPDDLVTDVDRSTERFFYEKVTSHFPKHHFLGEEGTAEKLDRLDGTVWIIDPIDGTMNFVHSQYHFAISVGVFHDGVGKVGIIYDVMNDEMFYAVQGEGAYVRDTKLKTITTSLVNESVVGVNARWLVEQRAPFRGELERLVRDVRGVRSFGSAALELAYVAAGRLDGYVSLKLSPWDYAAGKVLLAEVGGTITTLQGEELSLLEPSTLLAANSSLHSAIVDQYIKGE